MPAMRFLRRLRPLLAALLVALPAAAMAAPSPLERLAALREAGRFAEALAMARRFQAKSPGNADLLLVEGQLLGFLDRPDEALAVLAKAAQQAPDYIDIHLQRARIHFHEGDPAAGIAILEAAAPPGTRVDAELLRGRLALADGRPGLARTAFARVLAKEPTSGEALIGIGDAARVEGARATARSYYERALTLPGFETLARERLETLARDGRRWRLALGARLSEFSDATDAWRETTGELAYRADDDRRWRGGWRLAERYGERDVQLEAGIRLGLDARSGAWADLAFTPEADFLPYWRVRLGFDRTLLANPNLGVLGPTRGFVEGSLADYAAGLSGSLALGVTQYLGAGGSWLTGRVTNSLDSHDRHDLGLALRLDHEFAAPDLRLHLGYAHERDREARGQLRRDTVFVGLAYGVTERLELRLDAALERRDNGGDRRTLGLGVAVRF